MSRAKLNQMLQNLGERVLAAAGNGGKQIRKFDDAYAAKVRDMFGVNDPTVTAPLRKTIGAIAGFPVTYGPAREGAGVPYKSAAERAVGYAVPAASVTARYVAPTAAALALAKLTGQLYERLSQTPIIEQ